MIAEPPTLPPAISDAEVAREMRAKLSLLKLQQQQVQFLKNHRIYHFKEAYDEQTQFFNSRSHIRLAIGDNRSGKTTCGTAEDVSFPLGWRPWRMSDEDKKKPIRELMARPWTSWPELVRTAKKPPVTLIIVVEDWDKADEIFISGVGGRTGKLLHYLPSEAIARMEKNQQGYVTSIHLINGSVIRFETEKSFQNNKMSLEGGSADAIHYDEPKSEELRNALARGLIDTGGYEWFTFTPWRVGPWVYDKLVVKAASDPEVFVTKLDARKNPHIDQQARARFLSGLDEVERLARGEGQFTHLLGLVYPEFIAKPYPEGNILTTELEHKWIAENGTVYVGIDIHPRQPQTALYLCADNQDRWVVYDEIFKKQLIPEFCDMLHEKLHYGEAGLAKLEPELWEIDPIAFNEDPIDRRRWADEFHNHNPTIPVIPASKRKENGIAATRQAFKDKRLLISSKCHRTIWELQHYIYTEWSDRSARNEKERPVDKDDHTMEVLYRLVLREPAFVRRKAARPIDRKFCS